MESATVCIWIEGIGGVHDHTSQDNQSRKEGEKIYLCLIPNYPAKSKDASNKISELIVSRILQFEDMLSKNKKLPIVKF